MDRRTFLLEAGGLAAGLLDAANATAGHPPVPETHFPDRLHLFVWRNWEWVDLDGMAAVVGCRADELRRIGTGMGLPAPQPISPERRRRGYITIIRQNWHVLPNEQLIQLLGWDRVKFLFTLREDDFLQVKLGPKPDCPALRYSPPDARARQRAAEIRKVLETHLGAELQQSGEPAFAFVHELGRSAREVVRDPQAHPAASAIDVSGWQVRGDKAVDARIVERFADYLRTAMRAGAPRPGAKVIQLRLEATRRTAAEHFTVLVREDRVDVSAGDVAGLLQAIYWMQDHMEEQGGPFLRRGRTTRHAAFQPRYVYPFFALYGDPLLEPEIDPFPEGYLEKLGRAGVDGVWMQCVLHTLAPSRTFPEFGSGWQTRLARLRQLVERTRRFGLKLYLYLNEPRAMPAAFFRRHPGMQGAREADRSALCTAVPAVRAWLSDSLAHVFEQGPGLGGVFTITMSENLTNCFSHGAPRTCPRCAHRHDWQAVGEVLDAIHRGVRRSSSQADIIVWDWGWSEALARKVVPQLPRDVRFLSVSEWSIPVERGGVKTTVGEYSISVVGPGPRARTHWALARQAGVKTMAKTQFNNTWELSAVPYIPVGYLIARHCANLVKAGVQGVMASWTLGGYPSPNLEIVREVCFTPAASIETVLERVARRRYGRAAASGVLAAWQAFSAAFEEFPYGIDVYCIPTQHGPANLLRAKPTGQACGMILFPWDNYKAWCGPYPPSVVRDQFRHLADGWERALPLFRKAVEQVPVRLRRRAELDLAIAETCFLHFRSVANQVEFYLLRDTPSAPQRQARMRTLITDEMELARRLYRLTRRHSILGYEASNHYYYRPLDLAEKIISCQYLLDTVLHVQT